MTDPRSTDARRDDLGERLAELSDAIAPVDVDLDPARIAALARRPVAATPRARILRAAAVVLLVVAAVVAIAPAHTAVADWLGIGSTSVDIVDDLPEVNAEDDPVPRSDDRADAIEAAASDRLRIEVALPRDNALGEPIGWELRTLDSLTGPVPELVVEWDDGGRPVRLTAWPAGTSVTLRKIVTTDPVTDDRLITDGEPALWLEGPHVRDTGDEASLVDSTLLWVRDGVEYRLSGDELTRDRAIEIAAAQG